MLIDLDKLNKNLIKINSVNYFNELITSINTLLKKYRFNKYSLNNIFFNLNSDIELKYINSDFSLNNLIYSKEKKKYMVIDWERFNLNSSFYDLCFTNYLNKCIGNSLKLDSAIKYFSKKLNLDLKKHNKSILNMILLERILMDFQLFESQKITKNEMKNILDHYILEKLYKND